MIAAATTSQSGSPSTISERETTTSNARFSTQSAPAKIGGRSSNSGTPWPGTYSPALDQELRGARRNAHADAAAVRRLDDLEQLLLVEPRVRHDDLVEAEPSPTAALEVSGRAARGEVVVDPAAARRRSSRAGARSGPARRRGARGGGRRTTAGGPRDHLVAPPEQADQPGDDEAAHEVQPEGRELLARPDREDQRQHRDEEHGRDDPPQPLAHLPLRVQAGAREDEHEQEHEERQPVGLVVPQEAPQDRLGIEDERAQREREVEAEDETGHVERREQEDARRAPDERPKGAARQEVRAARANVLDANGALDLGRRLVDHLPWRLIGDRGGDRRSSV